MIPGILSFILFFSLQEDTLERARLLAEAGRIEDAIRFLEGHTRRDPAAPALAYLAQLHAGTGGLPQAAEALGRALALAPEQSALRITRGAILFELRRYEEARSELELGVASSPGAARAHYYLGAVQQGMGELSLAEKSAERAIELSGPPSKATLASLEPTPAVAARHLLAEVRFSRGEGDVERLLREVLAYEPDHAPARYLLARSLKRRGREEDAREELRRFDAIKRAESHAAVGRSLANLGRGSEAVSELKLAIEAYPDHARALYLLGRELLRLGRKDEARSVLDRALALRPDASSEVNQLLASFP